MKPELKAISLPGEQWREVEEKGIRWHVSDCARVYVEGQDCRFTRVRLGISQTLVQHRKGGLLSPCTTLGGYLEVARKEAGGKRIKARVHRLVGLAWVPGFSADLSINHVDGDKLNNHPGNLEWVSLAENTRHQWGMGLGKGAEPRLSSKQVVYMRRLYRQGIPGHTIDIIAGVSPGYTQLLCSGKRRKGVLG